MLSRVAQVQPNQPSIYIGQRIAPHLSIGERLLAAAFSIACLSVLIIAASLTPNPDGLGTHRRLGLAECGFLERTGLPCPSCGMTTSFAWFARGNILASLYVQPMGTVLAAICCMGVWAGAYIGFTGRPVHRLLSSLPPRRFLIPLLGLAIAAWGWKIFIHLHGIDGWK